MIVIALVLVIIGRKQRSWIGATVALVGGVVWLIAVPEDRWSFLFITAVFSGVFADAMRGEQFKAYNKKQKLGSLFMMVVLCVFSYFMLGRSHSNRVGISESALYYDWNGGKINGMSIRKGDLTASLIHVTGDDFDEWRFRSKTVADDMIAIRAGGSYRDSKERVLSGDELARRIVDWAGVSYEEKSVKNLYDYGDR
jgi:hypothetical protein